MQRVQPHFIETQNPLTGFAKLGIECAMNMQDYQLPDHVISGQTTHLREKLGFCAYLESLLCAVKNCVTFPLQAPQTSRVYFYHIRPPEFLEPPQNHGITKISFNRLRATVKRRTVESYPGTFSGGAYFSESSGPQPIPTRKVFEAVLLINNTGAPWHLLPQCYPNYKIVHRCFQHRCLQEALVETLTDLANTLLNVGAPDESEYFIDTTFA